MFNPVYIFVTIRILVYNTYNSWTLPSAQLPNKNCVSPTHLPSHNALAYKHFSNLLSGLENNQS